VGGARAQMRRRSSVVWCGVAAEVCLTIGNELGYEALVGRLPAIDNARHIFGLALLATMNGVVTTHT
jgi:hypothetical protein